VLILTDSQKYLLAAQQLLALPGSRGAVVEKARKVARNATGMGFMKIRFSMDLKPEFALSAKTHRPARLRSSDR